MTFGNRGLVMAVRSVAQTGTIPSDLPTLIGKALKQRSLGNRRRQIKKTGMRQRYRSSSSAFFHASLRSVATRERFFFHGAHELLVGRLGDDAGKLGTVVVHDADVFNNYVVDFPILIDQTQPVVD